MGFCLQIALLKILLAAAPTSKAKTDSINILADVLPEEMPWVKLIKIPLLAVGGVNYYVPMNLVIWLRELV